MTLLGYDIRHPALRSPAKEWPPHAAQTRRSAEWWYLTSLAFDNDGGEWSFAGDAMHVTVASPALLADLRLTGAGQVMYAKDRLGYRGLHTGRSPGRPQLLLLPAAHDPHRSRRVPGQDRCPA